MKGSISQKEARKTKLDKNQDEKNKRSKKAINAKLKREPNQHNSE